MEQEQAAVVEVVVDAVCKVGRAAKAEPLQRMAQQFQRERADPRLLARIGRRASSNTPHLMTS